MLREENMSTNEAKSKTTVKKQKSKNESMKKRTSGVRQCKICNSRKGMIRKYSLGICRRCFKARAQDLGWEKY
jgi:small subunit ribosomal protein S29e